VSLLSLVAVLAGLFWGVEKVYHKLDVPVGVIAVKGQFTHVDQVEVQSLVEPLVNGGIISLNLAEIRNQLELHPWIERVTVSRQWPGGLIINVMEETPIARWGKDSFLNSSGEMLTIGDNSGLAHLPLLNGGKDTERSLMKAYREIAQLLQPSNLKIASLRRDQRGAWWLELNNGLDLVIGRDQVMDKMRRFLTVWKSTLKGRVEEIAQVDVRYDNGIAVKWIEKTALEQTQVINKLITTPGQPGQV
jgi:cell division protein FtsQ